MEKTRPVLMTAHEVADLLRIRRNAVDAFVARNILPVPYRLGVRALRWREDEVMAALERSRTAA